MKFKIDENLPADVVGLFRQASHDAMSVFDQKLVGRPDREIATVCQQENRAIVTLDTDFGNVVAYPPSEYPGIIVIRTSDQSKPNLLNVIRRVLLVLTHEPLEHKLWIVEADRIRIRGASSKGY